VAARGRARPCDADADGALHPPPCRSGGARGGREPAGTPQAPAPRAPHTAGGTDQRHPRESVRGELVRLLRAGESDCTITQLLGHNRRTIAK